MIDSGEFPEDLEYADVIPAFKRGDRTDWESYRPISLLRSPSKLFERLLERQISFFMKERLSKFLCGFRKGHSTQHALLNLIVAWQRCLANEGKVGTVLMDLSKAFDTLPHDLLIAKLHAYGLDRKGLRLIYSYLSNRKMRFRIGSVFS